MSITPTLYDRIEDVPPQDWTALITDPADLAMDPRLLTAFQSTMTDQCRCWFVVIRDERQRAIATACLCLFSTDALETTGPAAQSVTRFIRKLFPGFMRLGVLFCGLPAPSADNHLRIAPDVDRAAVFQSLHDVMLSLARKHRARLIVLKEFSQSHREDFGPLEAMGYLVGDVPSARRLEGEFDSFENFCGAMRARYRKQVMDSVTRFRDTGCEMEYVCGERIAAVMTPDVHRLYLAVRDKAKYRMETFPPEFFHEIGRQFGDDAVMTLVRRNGSIIGFVFSLARGHESHNLYVGVDYAQNSEVELYFNLHYLDLDRAFRRGCKRIHLGQTSDEFKSRLGCSADALSFYVRAVNPIFHAVLRQFSRWVFPPVKAPTLLNVFRAEQSKKKVEQKVRV